MPTGAPSSSSSKGDTRRSGLITIDHDSKMARMAATQGESFMGVSAFGENPHDMAS